MSDVSADLSIKAASHITGVRHTTLRYWEKLGLIHPRRSRGRHRYYPLDQVREIRRVKKALQSGKLKASDLANLWRKYLIQNPALSLRKDPPRFETH